MGTGLFFAPACAITWVLAAPAALAWMQHQAPPPFALACAGLSAFGPLLAALAIAGNILRRDPTRGLIERTWPLFRSEINGMRPNSDTWAEPL